MSSPKESVARKNIQLALQLLVSSGFSYTSVQLGSIASVFLTIEKQREMGEIINQGCQI